MKQYTVRQVIMISETQAKSLEKLKQYDVNISQFIRQAIKEKINLDWKTIKEEKQKIKLPF
jgi:post-segregation antitoxin (ccd killing protein)